ncbi:MAG TPA: hypothetical protein VMV92_15940 [Streptosporangiaceae bacterium]|nr:hypothetical protein [Streptosporangiaceae bacterium]
MHRAGLGGYVERVISAEEARTWKPPAAVYRHAASVQHRRACLSPAGQRLVRGERRRHRYRRPARESFPATVRARR